MDGKLQVDAVILDFSKAFDKGCSLKVCYLLCNWIIMGLEGSCIVG